MNIFSIVSIVLGSALSVTNSTILLVVGENGFSREIKEILLFFSIVFGLGSIYGVYQVSTLDSRGYSINRLDQTDSLVEDLPKNDRYLLVDNNEDNHLEDSNDNDIYRYANSNMVSPDTIDKLYNIYTYEHINKL
jgi:hypothetical protein